LATGAYSDLSTQVITSSASTTWSSNSGVATVSGGLVKCLAAGAVTITAASGAESGSTAVTCLAPVLQSISVAAAAPSIVVGNTDQLTATGTYSDQSTQNLTSSVTWTSGNVSVATVSAVSPGLVTCVAAGSATITATSGGKLGSTTVTCQAPVLQSISVTSNSSGEIDNGGTRQMIATGRYSFGPTQDVTGTAAWSSIPSTVATVSSTGIVSCKRRNSYLDGVALISATIGKTTGSIFVVCDGIDDD
jgi:hypothetical protein